MHRTRAAAVVQLQQLLVPLLLLGGCCVGAQVAGDGVITTVAGGASGLFFSNATYVANATYVGIPRGVATDRAGNAYYADEYAQRVWLLNVTTGLVTTVAGNGVGSFSGDGGPATSASLKSPSGVAVDAAGNVLVADTGNHRIRRVAAVTGIITTVAGNGSESFSGDGGPGTSASLNSPYGVAVDAGGNVLIADKDNHRIRRLNSSSGVITTVAGNGVQGFSGDGGAGTSASLRLPSGVAVDATGSVLIADYSNHRIRRLANGTGVITTVAGNGAVGFSGDWGPATSAQLNFPRSIAADSNGALFIADTFNNRIRQVAAGTRIITTVAGNGLESFSGDGGPGTSASLNSPEGVAVDAGGNVIIADNDNLRIRRLAIGTGVITTVAGNGTFFIGDGGPATGAIFKSPSGVGVDAGSNVLVADTSNHRIRRVAAGTGIITTVAGNGVGDFSGDGGPATSASLKSPSGATVDAGGNMLIADTFNHRIRRVAAGTGIITTVAGNGVGNFSGDGGPATSASIKFPSGVAVDAGGNVLIADKENHRIRRVAAGTGIITTVAGNGVGNFSGDGGPATSASLRSPPGVAVDAGGNVLIADMVNNRIRRVAACTGFITTVAGNGTFCNSGDGGPATSACFRSPSAVAVDAGGNVIIADRDNHRIRRVAAGTGNLTTVAGNGVISFSGDGGPGTSASVALPSGVAVDADGNILIADRDNNRIRLAPATLCSTALFRALPRTDLVGALVGSVTAPQQPVLVSSEAACRQACCDASACDGYSFASGAALVLPLAPCYLLVNITALVGPSNIMNSSIRESALL